MTYDCFLFFNELDLLELRLNILDACVDKFVLLEADKTFTGNSKPYYFEENKERFARFLDKIIHVKVEDIPGLETAWDRERYQRDSLTRGLEACDDSDIILISDLDEIPNPEVVTTLKPIEGAKGFGQLMFYYSLNFLNTTTPLWIGTYQTNVQYLRQQGVDVIRNKVRRKKVLYIPHAGWHFSYLGDTQFIMHKIQSQSHQEFNNDDYNTEAKISAALDSGADIFNRGFKYLPVRIDHSFPAYIRENQEKYAHWLRNWNEDDISAKDLLPTSLPGRLMYYLQQKVRK